MDGEGEDLGISLHQLAIAGDILESQHRCVPFKRPSKWKDSSTLAPTSMRQDPNGVSLLTSRKSAPKKH